MTDENINDLDNICDECKEKHESVFQNLILIGFKISLNFGFFPP